MMNELLDGPYPLAVGMVPPTQVKIWYSSVARALVVWNWQAGAWKPVSSTVTVGATPPSGIGDLYVDPNNKLWVMVDDLCELTFPTIGSLRAVDGASLVVSDAPPMSPNENDLWLEPYSQNLSQFNGFVWVLIGTRVVRDVRFGNYAGTWNAGGNRSQAVVAKGPFLCLSGIRGIDPKTQQQLPGPGPGNTPGASPNANARVEQIYQNIKTIAEAEGLVMHDCVRLVTSVTHSAYINTTAELQALEKFWGDGPYPIRTHQGWLFMSGSDTIAEYPVVGWPGRGDVAEIEAMFSLAHVGRRRPSSLADDTRALPDVTVREIT